MPNFQSANIAAARPIIQDYLVVKKLFLIPKLDIRRRHFIRYRQIERE